MAHFEGETADLVVCDGAPDVTGLHDIDGGSDSSVPVELRPRLGLIRGQGASLNIRGLFPFRPLDPSCLSLPSKCSPDALTATVRFPGQGLPGLRHAWTCLVGDNCVCQPET